PAAPATQGVGAAEYQRTRNVSPRSSPGSSIGSTEAPRLSSNLTAFATAVTTSELTPPYGGLVHNPIRAPLRTPSFNTSGGSSPTPWFQSSISRPAITPSIAAISSAERPIGPM